MLAIRQRVINTSISHCAMYASDYLSPFPFEITLKIYWQKIEFQHSESFNVTKIKRTDNITIFQYL